uniref:Uncharacterized protein n=1 Tax=Macrostomum lignano TaxID=282301 RepID=A0A1I8FF64_9PLAT
MNLRDIFARIVNAPASPLPASFALQMDTPLPAEEDFCTQNQSQRRTQLLFARKDITATRFLGPDEVRSKRMGSSCGPPTDHRRLTACSPCLAAPTMDRAHIVTDPEEGRDNAEDGRHEAISLSPATARFLFVALMAGSASGPLSSRLRRLPAADHRSSPVEKPPSVACATPTTSPSCSRPLKAPAPDRLGLVEAASSVGLESSTRLKTRGCDCCRRTSQRILDVPRRRRADDQAPPLPAAHPTSASGATRRRKTFRRAEDLPGRPSVNFERSSSPKRCRPPDGSATPSRRGLLTATPRAAAGPAHLGCSVRPFSDRERRGPSLYDGGWAKLQRPSTILRLAADFTAEPPGVPASESMLRNDTVYISDKIRHLLVDPSTGLFKSNVNFEVITVCFSRRFDHSRGSRQYEMFRLPGAVRWPHKSLLTPAWFPGARQSPTAARAKAKQWCCDFIKFSDKHREEQKRLSKVLIAIICVGSFAVVILIVLIVACIHHSCSRQNGRIHRKKICNDSSAAAIARRI